VLHAQDALVHLRLALRRVVEVPLEAGGLAREARVLGLQLGVTLLEPVVVGLQFDELVLQRLDLADLF
jgi:phosphohistidine swiveling domain-containing protein